MQNKTFDMVSGETGYLYTGYFNVSIKSFTSDKWSCKVDKVDCFKTKKGKRK